MDDAPPPVATPALPHEGAAEGRPGLDREALLLSVLGILARERRPLEAARRMLHEIRMALGLEAAALRLDREGDFTYAVHEGLPEAFVQAENCLRMRLLDGKPLSDAQGRPLLACTCGCVIMGAAPPGHPLFTAGGSAWTPDSAAYAASAPPGDPRLEPRDRCLHEGYRTVALVPVRAGEAIVGLLQLMDHRPGRLDLDRVTFLERLSASLGIALERVSEETRRQKEVTRDRLMQESSRSGTWEWDVLSGQVTWSEGVYRILGLGDEGLPLTPEDWLARVHPDDREVGRLCVRQWLGTPAVQDREWRMVRSDGAIRWVQIRALPQMDGEGRFRRYLGVALDVTERRNEEIRHAEAFRRNPLPMVLVRVEDARILDVNEAWTAVTGWSREESMGRTQGDLGLLVSAEEEARLREEVANAGRLTLYSAKVRRKDGSVRDLRLQGAVLDLEGDACLLVSARDVTERLAMERALRESEARHRLLVEHGQDITFTLDAASVLTYASPAWTRLLGHPVEEVVGRTAREFIHPDDLPACEAYLARLLSGDEDGFVTYRARHQDGSWRWHMSRGAPLRDAGGAVTGALATARDIHAMHLAEEALIREREVLEAVFNSMPGTAFLYDDRNRLVKWNGEHERLTGYSSEELASMSAMDWFPGDPESQASIVKGIAETLARGFGTAEARLCTKDGRRIPMHFSARPVLLDGRIHYAGIGVDVTERHRAQEKERELTNQLHHAQKMESLGSLAGGVAHDLNNVLAAILGIASALRVRLGETDPVSEGLDTISRACTRGRDVVKALLRFSSRELDQERPLDLNAVVRETVGLLERTTLRRVTLHMDLQEPLPWLLGDFAALSHALVNLCVNAVDAMVEGGAIYVSTRAPESGGLVLEVRDTGQGMTPEVLEKAMEPFFTTKPVGKGTGLGLAMVYGTLQAHEGSVALSSRPGEGTTVTLSFPGSRVVSTASLDPPAPPAPAAGLRILVVDDDDLVLQSVVAMLECLGHEAVAAAGGREALGRLEAGLAPDLVILDMNMPDLSGAEVLPRILALRPGQPVLMASGYLDDQAMALQEAHPSVSVLAKPFSLDEVEAAIGAVARQGSGPQAC